MLAGALLLAGAEPEELVTAVLAAVRGHPGLAAGDALGANVTMLTAVLGLAALVRPLPFSGRVRSYALLSSATGLGAVAVVADGHAGRVEGVLLLLAYAVGVGVVWWREKAPPVLGELAEGAEDDDDGDGDGRPPAVGLLLALAGVGVMTAGGAVAVEGATRVVRLLGQSDTSVGLTVLALVTTAELFALVVAAARRGVAEIAVAGVVGSATCNATLTLGAAAAARPLTTGPVLGPAIAAALLPAVLVVVARSGRLGRLPGAVLVAGYAVFAATSLT